MNVYPMGIFQIRCITSEPDDLSQFNRSCTGGEILGEGPVVYWQVMVEHGD